MTESCEIHLESLNKITQTGLNMQVLLIEWMEETTEEARASMAYTVRRMLAVGAPGTYLFLNWTGFGAKDGMMIIEELKNSGITTM